MAGFDPLLLLYIGVFVGALMVFEGVRQAIGRDAPDAVRKSRRMRMIEKGASRKQVLDLLRPKETAGDLARIPLLGGLPRELRRAGIAMRPGTFILACLGGCLVLSVIAMRFAPTPVAALAGVALGFGAPIAILRSKAKKRVDSFVAQLPEALDLMARGLRVGHPLNATIASVAREMPDPIGSEFGLVFDQVSYGDDLVTAMRDMADRVEVEDMRYLVSSVAIQHGTGGNLARVLGVLAKVIRDRATMRRKVKAVSSEGRMTMWILSVMPLGIFAMTHLMSPDYYGAVMGDPLFIPVVSVIGALTLANALILRKLVNFRY